MALSSDKVKSLLHSVKNANNKANLVWKPELGTNTIRIVPYKFNPDEFSFTTLKFHYGLKVKDSTGAIVERTFLSPDSFNRPDPIVEWANRLQKTGDKNDWKFGRSLIPKARTYAPILVRGKEGEGLKFWGFGKTVFESILNACDPELFGDISDPVKGHDIIVEYKQGADGKAFPTTTITVKPKPTVAIDDARKNLLEYQTNILELFPEPSYETLYNIMNDMMSSLAGKPDEEVHTDVTADVDASPTATTAQTNNPNVDDQFDKLFNKKS